MQKIVVAITGASGAIYAKVLMDKLLAMPDQWTELGVVLTENAKQVWEHELGDTHYTEYMAGGNPATKTVRFFDKKDFNAPFASGSAQFNTMIVIPCSMGTMGRIANGLSDDLITRAADVILKERRRLILVAREAPYNLVHIRNMEQLTLAGAIICPATPSFYSRPKTIEEVAATVVDRVIDLAGLHLDGYRWGEHQF